MEREDKVRIGFIESYKSAKLEKEVFEVDTDGACLPGCWIDLSLSLDCDNDAYAGSCRLSNKR